MSICEASERLSYLIWRFSSLFNQNFNRKEVKDGFYDRLRTIGEESGMTRGKWWVHVLSRKREGKFRGKGARNRFMEQNVPLPFSLLSQHFFLYIQALLWRRERRGQCLQCTESFCSWWSTQKVRNDGGLGGACCHTVKASDANGDDPKRVICLYFDSCWNEKHAKKVNPLEKRIDIVSKRSLGTNWTLIPITFASIATGPSLPS